MNYHNYIITIYNFCFEKFTIETYLGALLCLKGMQGMLSLGSILHKKTHKD